MNVSLRNRLLLLAGGIVIALVAGCAPPTDELVCNPGVEDLARTAEVAPSGC